MQRSTGLLAAALACSFGANLAAQAETAETRFEPRRKFDIILPKEAWAPATHIAIRHDGGGGFATEKDGLALRIDTDADGRVDRKIQGADGYAVLKGKRDDGSTFGYAVRFRQAGQTYTYSTSCVMAGSLHGVSIDLIDQDNDGVFNEVGVDAMIVGGGKAACYLSEVVNLKGKLYTLRVEPDGSEISAEPFQGASGVLRVRGGLNLPGKLIAAVVSDADGRCSFEVGSTKELRVPAGSYEFSGGFAKSGGDTARLRAGSMKPLVVTDGGTTSLEKWGAPLVAEFDFTRDGDIVTVHPMVRFIGRGGEEWHTLLPDAKSPKLVFLDADRNKVLDTKRFAGC